MTVAFARLKSRLTNWRSWELNPVVVKELRQSVRSWAVTGMLLLFLVVLFCTALAFLVAQSFQISMDQQLGGRVFQSFVAILTGASLLFIPLYIGVRLAAERQESNLDLLYITTLTPQRIIRGKFLCGAYMAVLFFSACMPFMVFTNLLRGIDLPTIAFILACLFLIVCAAIQVGIFVACLPISKLFKILLALIGTVAMVPTTVSLIEIFFGMMRTGIGSILISGGNFWPGFFTSCAVLFGGMLLLYFLSVALISPLSANRALPLRLYMTVIWLGGGAISFFWMRKVHDARMLLPWAILTFIALGIALAVVVSNSDQLSLRVRRTIPVSPAKRALAFLFYNGAAGGLVWAGLLIVLTYAVTSLFQHWSGTLFARYSGLSGDNLRDFDVQCGAVLLYAFGYALAALLIHRQFFSRRTPRLAGVFALLLPAAWALIPNVVLFFVNKLSWESVERNQLGNMFNVFIVKTPEQRSAHFWFAAVCVLVTLVLNAKWFIRQVRNFQPLRRVEETANTKTEVPPSIPVAMN